MMSPTASDSTVTPASVTLDREQLRAKLARGDRFQLVMAAKDWAFRAKHIPGSVHFSRPEDLFAAVSPEEEIVVYCSNEDCHASLALIQKLREHGYRHVGHYSGGLIDWETAGLPLEGDWTHGDREG
jgi:rhodanese-related sulfurtransferase